MGLKQSIVIKNEYSINDGKGGGSRGGTPGDYVLRYMARDGATEISTPVQYDQEAYITRYMARQDAVESLDDEADILNDMKRHQKHGGVAFGNNNLSMSHVELINSSKGIQKAFDDGKTVLKTVISFDEDYLRENGIISPNFVHKKKGDFRGNIDQMKLRYAIMHGMDFLAHDYDDLRYIGVIQVDTDHVHCHLAMVDMGRGNIVEDGTQKGKISAKMMMRIRRGIDLALDESKEVQYMASNVDIDKRNVQTNLRRYTYQQVTLYGAPQKIMSVLPDDETLWRAKSNRKEMKEANKICRDYVEAILNKSDSGMEHVMQGLYNYVDARAEREDLSDGEKLDLIHKSRENMVLECMNSVYMTLRQIPDENRSVSTDLLTLSASPIVTPSFSGDSKDFVYKSKAYSARLERHRHQTKRYAGFIKEYEEAAAQDAVDPTSDPLYQYFLIEEEYHEKLASKYSQFLFFDEPSGDFADEYLNVYNKAQTLMHMEQLRDDRSAKRMTPENAEEYGRQRYDIYGGKYVVINPERFDKRIEEYRRVYEAAKKSFDARLASENRVVETDESGAVVIKRKPAHDFEDVKGLDLHDLRGDFSESLQFSGYVRRVYLDMANRRVDAYHKACEYLDDTGQSELKGALDTADVQKMEYVRDLIAANSPVAPVAHPEIDYDEKRVIPLDNRMHKFLSERIKANVQQIEYAELMNTRPEEPEDTNFMLPKSMR